MNDLISWGLFLLVNSLAIKSSYSTAAFLNRSDRSFALSLVTTGLVYLASITVLILLLGTVFHAIDRTTVAGSSVGLSLLLIAIFRRKRRPVHSEVSHAWMVVHRERDLFLNGIVLIFLVQVLILLVKVSWLPPHIWDVFYYHLTPAVEWFQRGEIPFSLDVAAQYMNHVPLGMTILSYWFFIFFGDDFLVNLPQTLWVLMLVPAAYLMARLGGMGRAWAIKFAIMVFFIPFVLMQAITVKDHLGLTVSFFVGMLMLALYLRSHDARLIVSAGIAFGLMLGYKKAAPALLAVALVIFLVFLWINRARVIAHARQGWHLFFSTAIAVVTMSAIASFWYLRRLHSGSMLTALPPSRGIGPNIEHHRFSFDALIHNVPEFFLRMMDTQGHLTADLIGISGFGPQFVSFGLLALLIGMIFIGRRKEYRRPEFFIVLTAIMLFVVFLCTNYSANANSYRILVFLPIIMIIYAGILMWRLRILQAKASAMMVNIVITVCILWSLVATLPPALTNPMEFKAYITAPRAYQTSGTYTQWFSIHRPDFHHVLAAMPVQEPVAILSPPVFNRLFRKGQSETWSYPYYDRHWQRRLVYFRHQGILSCDQKSLSCRPSAQLKRALREKNLHLVSTCPINRCVRLIDADFFELAPGFYYFKGTK